MMDGAVLIAAESHGTSSFQFVDLGVGYRIRSMAVVFGGRARRSMRSGMCRRHRGGVGGREGNPLKDSHLSAYEQVQPTT